ncbi:hypothetical protein PHSC3_000499 [Chlamydiales bacterium STE3]|nr:hypothetical protein PHSC3_000499 [Chlamydiales bacterium STE3]
MFMKQKHLVFYDGECGFCDQTVQFLLKRDTDKRFLFAPLKGETANHYLKQIPSGTDSLVLIENYQTPQEKLFLYGKAALRILWLLGGRWTLLGMLSFLPSFFYDWAYRLVARYRYRFYSAACRIHPLESSKRDQFLK